MKFFLQILPKFIVENGRWIVYFQHLLASGSHKEPTFYVLGKRGELCFLLRGEYTSNLYLWEMYVYGVDPKMYNKS